METHETILIRNEGGVQEWLCFYCGHHRRFDSHGMTILEQGDRTVSHEGGIEGTDRIVEKEIE